MEFSIFHDFQSYQFAEIGAESLVSLRKVSPPIAHFLQEAITRTPVCSSDEFEMFVGTDSPPTLVAAVHSYSNSDIHEGCAQVDNDAPYSSRGTVWRSFERLLDTKANCLLNIYTTIIYVRLTAIKKHFTRIRGSAEYLLSCGLGETA